MEVIIDGVQENAIKEYTELFNINSDKEIKESDLVKLAINRFINDVEELTEEDLILNFKQVIECI